MLALLVHDGLIVSARRFSRRLPQGDQVTAVGKLDNLGSDLF